MPIAPIFSPKGLIVENDARQDNLATDDAGEEMTASQRAEAKQYARRELVCELVDKVVDLAFLALVAFAAARPLDEWLLSGVGIENMWLRLAAMFGIVIGAHLLISFPLSFYSGHVLEHKYNLSKQSVGRWLTRYAKRNLLTVGFGVLMVEGLYLVIWLSGSWWWLVAAGAFFVVSVVMGQLVPVLILPMFYKIERLEDESLSDRFTAISDGTGLSIEGVYRMEMSAETVKANAMLTGMGSTRRVILGDTLLDEFSEDEIEVVFAHEVGHHVHRHIRKMIATGVAFSIVSFLICDRLIGAWVGDGNWTAAPPVFTLPLFMFIVTLFSLVLEPMQNGISRHYERQSDRYALDRTGKHDAYRSAFTKLAKINKADMDPHPAEVFFLHSHPPITERLAMADQ